MQRARRASAGRGKGIAEAAPTAVASPAPLEQAESDGEENNSVVLT